MQSGPVVVVQAFLPNSHSCVDCSSLLEGVVAQHVCSHCVHPQPLRREENYFEALGAPRRFRQNIALLEKTFYEVSRALHPDRFTHAGAEVMQRSIQRMSFVNEAYRTLKSQGLLRDYFLQRAGIRGPEGSSSSLSAQNSKLPLEWAEMWFEIQDLMLEDRTRAELKLKDFEGQLLDLQSSLNQKLQWIENQYDQKADQGIEDRSLLLELDEELKKENYLKSMQRDVDRMKKNAHSN